MPAAGTRDRSEIARLITARAGVDEKARLLLESERWPRERRDLWVAEKLEPLLEEARRTPFWSERIEPGAALSEVPLLEREELRAELDRLRTPGERLVSTTRTSGSTGRPVEVEHGPAAVGFAAAARLRQLTWFGLPPRDLPQANVHNHLPPDAPAVNRLRDDPPLFEVSPWTFYPDLVARAHAELVAAGGVTLLGCNSGEFEQWAGVYAASGCDARELGAKLGILGSEMTEPAQRRRIEEVFGCPTAEMYGSHEAPMIATECAAGSLHLNEEVVLLEVLSADGSTADPGELGEVAITLIHNTELPLLRYRLGDAATLLEGECECGVTLRRLDLRVGHLEEMAVRPDGSLVHAAFVKKVMNAALGDRYAKDLHAWHCVQEGPSRVVIYLDLGAPLHPDAVAAIERLFAEFLRAPIAVELVEDAERARPRLPNGKRRAFTRLCD